VSLKYAILGLLLERRGYGYELDRRLSARLGPTWRLNRAAVYSALDQLESAGLVRGTRREAPAMLSDRVVRRSTRVIYEPTPRGESEFVDWLTTSGHRRGPIRSEFHLKVAVARPMDIPSLLQSLDHEERLVRQDYAECVEPLRDLASSKEWPEHAAELLRAAVAARLYGELSWIQMVRQVLKTKRSCKN
jgi:DNA-binding PadR family transcriptional regulator